MGLSRSYYTQKYNATVFILVSVILTVRLGCNSCGKESQLKSVHFYLTQKYQCIPEIYY